MNDLSSPERVLNCIRAIENGCGYQILNAGFSSEFISISKRIIRYVAACIKSGGFRDV